MLSMIDYVWIVEIVSEKVCDLQKKIENDRELAFRGRVYMLATLQTHDAAPPHHGRQCYGPRDTSPHHYVEPLLHTSPDKDVNQHSHRPSHTRNKENCESLWYTVYNLHSVV